MMRHDVLSVCSPLKQECEDAFIVNEQAGVFGVLDGVTPLCDFRDVDGHNGAVIASRHVKAHFEGLKRVGSLTEEIGATNALLKRRMLESGLDLAIKHEYWATCIAAVHIQDEWLTYGQLGDSIVIAEHRDGQVEVLTPNTLVRLNERARAVRERDRLLGVKLPDESYYAVPVHTYTYNRYLANTPEGYSVLNGMDEVPEYIRTGRVRIDRLKQVLMISDGLFFPGKSLEDTYRMIAGLGLREYVDKLTLHEQEHALTPDDKTGLFVYF